MKMAEELCICGQSIDQSSGFCSGCDMPEEDCTCPVAEEE